MTTLIESCGQLLEGLQKVKVANQARQELSALQQRRREWEEVKNQRAELLTKACFFDYGLLSREDVKEADNHVQSLALEAKQVLENGGNVQDLANNSLWARLLGAAGASNDLLREALKSQWQNFIESLGHVVTPQSLDGQMLRTPANEALIVKYKQSYLIYQAAARAELPVRGSKPSDLLETVEALRSLSEQLRGTAPVAVRQFLRAVESGGADLELLTPEVIEWLRENDNPSRFQIKSRIIRG